MTDPQVFVRAAASLNDDPAPKLTRDFYTRRGDAAEYTERCMYASLAHAFGMDWIDARQSPAVQEAEDEVVTTIRSLFPERLPEGYDPLLYSRQGGPICHFNNHPDTTKEDAIRVFGETAERLRSVAV